MEPSKTNESFKKGKGINSIKGSERSSEMKTEKWPVYIVMTR